MHGARLLCSHIPCLTVLPQRSSKAVDFGKSGTRRTSSRRLDLSGEHFVSLSMLSPLGGNVLMMTKSFFFL